MSFRNDNIVEPDHCQQRYYGRRRLQKGIEKVLDEEGLSLFIRAFIEKNPQTMQYCSVGSIICLHRDSRVARVSFANEFDPAARLA